jgi:hypothetical protein
MSKAWFKAAKIPKKEKCRPAADDGADGDDFW